MKTIPLSKGYVALVDDEDFERVSQYSWHIDKRSPEQIYAQAIPPKEEGGPIRLHRLVMRCERGDRKIIDHINGDGLDNRKENLRICTQSQNLRNQRKGKNCSSTYKGVSWHKKSGKWRAYIKYNGRHIDIAYCDTGEEAAIYYDVAVQIFFDEFARLNGV